MTIDWPLTKSVFVLSISSLRCCRGDQGQRKKFPHEIYRTDRTGVLIKLYAMLVWRTRCVASSVTTVSLPSIAIFIFLHAGLWIWAFFCFQFVDSVTESVIIGVNSIQRRDIHRMLASQSLVCSLRKHSGSVTLRSVRILFVETKSRAWKWRRCIQLV